MKNFYDLVFDRHPNDNGWQALMKLGRYTLSVIAGTYYYSTPRADLHKIEDYTAFEVAVMDNATGNLVTQDIYPDEMDSVLAYRLKTDINDIIRDVLEFNSGFNLKKS